MAEKKSPIQKMPARVSLPGAWAFSLGTSVGWGSLVVTSSTYLAQAGPLGSALGLVAGMLLMMVISRNYAYLMNACPEPGGAYAYSREVFGYDHGFLTGWFLALTYLAVLWANATSIPLFARFFLGDLFQKGYLYTLFGYDVYLGEALLSLLALAGAAMLCVKSWSAAYRVMIGLVFLFTAGISIVFAGALMGLNRPMSPAFEPDADALTQIIQIAVISPWAFIGFESISHSAEEFSFNRKKSFRVLLIAVVAVILYKCKVVVVRVD